MFRFKRTWILYLVSVGFQVLFSAIGKILQSASDNGNNVVQFYDDFRGIFGDMLPILVLIFAVAVVADEYASRYNNNTFGLTPYKYKFVLCNLLNCFIFVISLFVITFISGLLFDLVLYGKNLQFDGLAEFATCISILLLLNFAVSVVAMFFTAWMRKSVPLTVGLVYGLMFCNLIYMGIDTLLNRAFDIKVSIENYTLFGNLAIMKSDFARSDVVRSIIVAIIYIFIFAVLNSVLWRKRDL